MTAVRAAPAATVTPWCGPDGTPLRADTPYTLTDGVRRWPVVETIPWLRPDRDDLRERAVAALDAGEPDRAAVALLADADDWWDGAPPPAEHLRAALHARTLRDAVALLGLGRVGVYFLHRWSDPSWLAALALTAAHPPNGRPVVDVACGAGHLLRHLVTHGHPDLTGVDVVFAKLWLARRFVLPPAAPVALVCADLTAAWPLPMATATAPRHVACHDALYFLPDKAAVVAAALACAGPQGAVLLGHLHNVRHPSGGAGLPLTPEGWTALLPGADAYAEEELTAATAAGRLPAPAEPAALARTEAVGLAHDAGAAPADPALLRPASTSPLQANPLYDDGTRRWPDPRWAAEYGERAATYLPAIWPSDPGPDAVRRRLLLDLPERW
ncbi:class I SAM-dependent methyltransferase [Micromonospora sp. WMMD1120]|uniref:class I SAM-dependent methyltransferase n=1 Tax=Micromonospora sp. WMMD1120 TaxID=3016106 RepID=UPI0024167963|nr:class I SAM-dependent methyltransferase [Micromonospora sp. WMMD1120]MDG4811016.1 class I SAM-dependent methyltransferase [Micromonospora sp. WMMD1120]